MLPFVAFGNATWSKSRNMLTAKRIEALIALLPLLSSRFEVVQFTLRPGDLAYLGAGNRPTLEPGTFDVWVAPSAESPGVKGAFELTA